MIRHLAVNGPVTARAAGEDPGHRPVSTDTYRQSPPFRGPDPLQRAIPFAKCSDFGGLVARDRQSQVFATAALKGTAGFGIAGCHYKALPPFEAPRLLDMLKA
jgi:hypothetical protein